MLTQKNLYGRGSRRHGPLSVSRLIDGVINVVIKDYKKSICFHRNEIKVSRYLSSVNKVIKFE